MLSVNESLIYFNLFITYNFLKHTTAKRTYADQRNFNQIIASSPVYEGERFEITSANILITKLLLDGTPQYVSEMLEAFILEWTKILRQSNPPIHKDFYVEVRVEDYVPTQSEEDAVNKAGVFFDLLSQRFRTFFKVDFEFYIKTRNIALQKAAVQSGFKIKI